MGYKNEDRQWLHNVLQTEGYNVGSYDEFEKSLQIKEDADWYFDEARKLGLEIGNRSEFDALMGLSNAKKSEGTPLYAMSEEASGGALPTLGEQVKEPSRVKGEMKFGKPGFIQDEATALYPMSKTSVAERLSDPRILDENNNIRSVQEAKEEEDIDKFYIYKPMNTAKDVYDNFNSRFTNTKRGIELGKELANATKDIQNKYVSEYLASDDYKALASMYKGEELAKRANEQFGLLYGGAINNELKPYNTAYNDELERRYGKQIGKELNRINKEEAGAHARELMTSVDSELEDIENLIAARAKAVRNPDWKPGMPSSRDDKKLAELRGERAYLEGAKELIEDSQKILNAVESENDGNFFGGLGRGLRDSAFDIDTWTMGLSDLVGGLRLRTALEKAERGEKLTSAEERLLDASVNNMAVNYYYRNDLGRGYQAGEITGQSIPFMLEFIVNPVSASGNAIAKSLLNYGMKRFAVGAIGKNAAKVGTRLVGDAIAAGGVTATSGLGNVMSGTVDRLNRNYEYGLDEEGNLKVTNTNEISLGEALAKSATTAFLERQSEMIFNAFKGAPSLFKGIEMSLPGGVNTFMNYINNSRVGELWRGIKNNATMRELAQRAQLHGLREEYLEEVYNNFANIPLGEMTFEEATDLEHNLVTFLGLAPTQVMFGAIGGIGYGVERYKARRDMERTFGRMTEEQKRKLMELQEMGKLSTNRDIAIFLAETIKDENLTPEQKRDEIEYAYNLVKQNAIDEMSNTDIEDVVESDNAQIDAATDPQTGMYGEVTMIDHDDNGEQIDVTVNVYGEKIVNGKLYLLVEKDGQKEYIRPMQYYPETYQKRPAEEVKAINEEMVREEAAAQAERESKYAPEVLSAQMQQGVPFNTPTSQIVPVSPMPEGNGWIVEEYPMDTDNKVAKQPIVREMTNDEFRDMLQAQIDAQEAAQKQAEEAAANTQAVVNNMPRKTDETGRIFVPKSVQGDEVAYDITDAQGNVLEQGTSKVSQFAQMQDYVAPVEELLNDDGTSVSASGERVNGGVNNPGVVNESLTTEKKPMTEDEAATFIFQMERNAMEAPEIELTPENWIAEFGEDGLVETPIGQVKFGQSQYLKLQQQGRNGKLGMIKPTLTSPDIIIEDASKAKEGDTAERGTSYVFVKAFKGKDGKRVYYFTSITIKKDGLEVVVSNQEKRLKQIQDLMMRGKLLWNRFESDSDSSGKNQAFSSATTENPNSGQPGSTAQSEISLERSEQDATRLHQSIFGEENGELVSPQSASLSTNKDREKNVQSQEKDQKPLHEREKEDVFRELGEKYGEKMPHKVSVTAKALAKDVTKARKKLADAQQRLDDAPIGRDEKPMAARDKAQQELDAIQREADFWAAMDAEVKAAQARRDAILNPKSEVDASNEPMTADELVAQQLAAGNIVIDKEDYKRETGYGDAEVEAMNGGNRKLLVNGGMSIQAAGERLEEIDREIGTNFFVEGDVNAGRNALLDVLGSVKSRKELNQYIANNRSEQAKRDSEAQRNELEKAIWDSYHISLEEFVARMEADELNNPYEGVDLAALDAIFAEAELERESLNEQEYESGRNVEGNQGQSELLSEPQSDNEGRSGESESERTANEAGGESQNDGETSQGGAEEVGGKPSRIASIAETLFERFGAFSDRNAVAYAKEFSSHFEWNNGVEALEDAKIFTDYLAENHFEAGFTTGIVPFYDAVVEYGRSQRSASGRQPIDILAEAERIHNEEVRRKPLRKRVKEWENLLGVKVNVIERPEDVKNQEALRYMAKGKTPSGWVESNGEVCIYLPGIPNVAEIDKTMIHEVVAHRGLKGLLGRERFNELCDKVWQMIPESKRAEYLDYVGDRFPNEQERQRAAADEYMAFLAEGVDITPQDQSVWKEIIKYIRSVIESVMGKTSLTDADIEELLRASFARLVAYKQAVDSRGGRTMFKFSKTPQEFDAVQKEAVEKKGIVMPGLNEAVVDVIETPIHDFSGKNPIDEARLWAEKNLVTSEQDKKENKYPKLIDGTPYEISKKKIGKFLSESATKKSEDIASHLSVLKKLKDIIASSIETEIHPDYIKTDGGRTGVEYNKNTLIHRFYGAANIEGKIYRVKTTIQEYRGSETNKPHSYEVIKIKLLDAPMTAKKESSVNDKERLSNNFIDVAKLLNGVEKSYDKGKKLLSESEKTRFRRVYHGSSASFDRFDHSFMGTGEGSQAYGWGTYVTEVEGIARTYASLKSDNSPLGTITKKWLEENPDYETFITRGEGARRKRNLEGAREWLEEMKAEGKSAEIIESYEQDMAHTEQMISKEGYEDTRKNMVDSLGRNLYEVEIPDDNGLNYLSWNDEVQKEKKRELVDAIYDEILYIDLDGAYDDEIDRVELKNDLWRATERGGDLYGWAKSLGGDRAASEFFSEHGYVGIKVPTNNLRDGDKSHWNYVIFNEDDLRILDHTRFRIANRNQEIFVSNAQKAVEGIKQEKGTPQQWLAMIEKNGGMKAGEDKWLGLSDWLNGLDKKSVTKDEILDFIGENKIRVEEVNYRKDATDIDELFDEYEELYENEGLEEAHNEMISRYGEEFDSAFKDIGGELRIKNQKVVDKILGKSINSTRLNYTTEGLENKAEIALTVPTIEPWDKSDEIHFGDAGEGRAIAWIRFGETTTPNVAFINAREAVNNYISEMREKYNVRGGGIYDVMNEDEVRHLQELTSAEFDTRDKVERVLVIDEIQSKRHQEGREHGYVDMDAYNKEKAALDEKSSELMRKRGELNNRLKEKYGDFTKYTKRIENGYSSKLVPNEEVMTPEEIREWNETSQESIIKAERELDKKYRDGIPSAPFEKNWHELAMKRMLRYAAENGYDKVAWTTGAQQAERYGLGTVAEEVRAGISVDGKRMTDIYFKDGSSLNMYHDENGDIERTGGRRADLIGNAKNISEVVGKELASKILAQSERGSKGIVKYDGIDLSIGGEGMKGFYDKMLPSFVNKYVKKWGTKVQDIELLNVEEAGRIMHSVDVTDAMKESVMEGQTMFRVVGEPAVAYATQSQAEDIVEVSREKEFFNMNNVASKLYQNSGRFMSDLYKNGTLGRVLRGEFAEIDQIKAKSEYDYAKPILDEYLNELVWMKHHATEAAQDVINDVIRDVEYSLEYYRDLSLGKDVWRTKQSPRFRIVDEKREAIQKEVDKFEKEYHGKPLMIVDLSMSDSELEAAFDGAFEADDVREFMSSSNAMAGYLSNIDKIAIFADRMKLERLTESLFHENIHGLLSAGKNNRLYVDFYEYGARENEAFSKWAKFVEDNYEPYERSEEFFAYVVSNAMLNDDLELVFAYLSTPQQTELKELLNQIGYDYDNRRRIKDESDREATEEVGTEPGVSSDALQVAGTDSRDRKVAGRSKKKTGSPREQAERLNDLFGKVADMGLDGVLGNKDYTRLMVNIYKELPEDVRTSLADDAILRYGGSIAPAVSDYVNVKGKASLWDKVVGFIREALRKMGVDVNLNANDAKYILWRSRKPLDRNNLLDVAEDIDMRYRLKVGEYNASTTNGSVLEQIKQARTEVEKNPTEAQKEAGNYKKGHITLDGYDITLENPKGGIRSGTDKNGKKWSITMNNDYGYIRGTEAVDGDHIDIFLSENPTEGHVFVVDQRNEDGSFDESKVMYGFNSLEEARQAYLSNYNKGWESRIMAITGVSKDEFKRWIYSSHRKTKPFSEYKNVKSNGGGTRFRVDVGNKLNIRDEYEATIKKGSYQAREAVQDAMLSLRRVQELIEKASGKKLRDFENAWMHENRLSSVVQSAIHEMERKYYKPMTEAVKKLMGAANLEQEQVADYLMLKHGIERNREMAVRKALTDSEGNIDRDKLNDWYEEKRRIRNDANLDTWRKKQEAMDDAALMFGADMSRDYSGLTSMFDTDDLADCTERAYNEVEALEDAHPAETEALGKAIKAMTQNTLDESFGSGLMNKAVYEELSNDMYDYYIPLRGFEETTSDEVYAYMDNDRGAFNAPLVRAKGRSSKSDNPLAYLKSIAESGIMQGERNKMKQTFLNMVTNHPSDLVSVREGVWAIFNPATGEWEAASFPESKVPRNATPADVDAAYQQWEADMEQRAQQDPNVRKVSEAADVPYRVIGNRMNQHQVIVKRLGKSYTLTINGNPRLAMALNGLTNPNNTSNDGKVSAFVQQKVDALNRTLSAWYTTRNPDFVASNFMRDTFYTNTIVRAKEGNNYANHFHAHYAKLLMPGRMISLFRKYENGTLDLSKPMERDFHEFMMNGGETGYSNLKDLEHIKKQIAKDLKGGRLEDVKGLLDKLDLVNRAVENTARFAAYRTSRQQGRSVARSIFDAKEISVNFNKKGAGGTFFGATGQTWFGNLAAMVGAGGRAMYVFFNAAIQGTTNLLHVMKVNPAGTGAGLAAMFLMGAVLPMLLGGDDEKDYYDLPEHVRRNHLILPSVGDSWISIPLPIEYRIMYGMGELLTSWRTEHERGSNIGMKMLSLTGQALPLNFLEEGVDAFMPSALSPLWQVYNNRSWTGLPIYKDNEFNKDNPEYTKAYKNVNRGLYKFTKALYRWTFDEENQEAGINLNPAAIEHIAKGYFGGLVTTLDNIWKTGEMIAGEREFDWRNIPVGNRIFKTGDERTKDKRIQNEYFENVDKLEFMQSRERLLRKTKDGAGVPEADKLEADEDYKILLGSDVYKKYVTDPNGFKAKKRAADKLYRQLKEQGDSEKLEMDYYKALEEANKAVR